jgi:hypothetical protein
MKEPLPANQARKLISLILNAGAIVIWDHCKEELSKDDMDTVDAISALRSGRIIEPAEPVGDRWRYRVHTERMCVVVQFESEEALSLVTAWRKKR